MKVLGMLAMLGLLSACLPQKQESLVKDGANATPKAFAISLADQGGKTRLMVKPNQAMLNNQVMICVGELQECKGKITNWQPLSLDSNKQLLINDFPDQSFLGKRINLWGMSIDAKSLGRSFRLSNGSNLGNNLAGNPPTPDTQSNCVEGTPQECLIESLIFQKTNAFRAENGSRPLTFNPKISWVAREHSAYQFGIRDINHNGFQQGARSRAFEKKFGQRENIASENVAMFSGSVNPQNADAVAGQFVTQWINSRTGHRENMLNSSHKHMGAGVKCGQRDCYATQLFGGR